MMRFLALWFGFVACGPVVEEVTDGGQVCLPLSVTAGEPATLTYVESCLSGSLQAVELSCSAALAGDVVSVTTFLTYERPRNGETTADCREYEATCDTPALAEGTYTVRLGDDEQDLLVPSAFDPPLCVGGP